MKKLLLAAAFVAAMGVATLSTTEVMAKSSQSQVVVSEEVEFVKIEVSALPEAVTAAVAKTYEGATVKEAFENKEAKLYKVVITVSEDKEVTEIYNEAGELQKENQENKE